MHIHRCYTLLNLILAAVLTIGFASSALAQDRALFVDLNSKEVTTLGTLGGNSSGGDYSSASGINDAGQVVGRSWTDKGEDHAFITGPDGVGMTDLGSVVNQPTGFNYFNATAINNHGQLAVVAAVVPEPEMYAMLLLGLGLIGFLARGRATA
jgi:probable HAF family extracellular repeat protein